MLRDRFGRPPAEAEELVRQFRIKAQLDPYHITRLAWREDRYLLQYQDPVALETLVAGRVIRPLRALSRRAGTIQEVDHV